MDFLTRLAHRMTGALLVVQPRLPARFEPLAASAQLAAPPADEISFSAAGTAKPTPIAASVSPPAPPSHFTAPLRFPQDVTLPRQVNSAAEPNRPPRRPAADEIRERADPPFELVPDILHHPPPESPAPRRTPVEARPARAADMQPQAIVSRRGFIEPLDDRTRPFRPGRPNDSGAASSTIHVHIGRVDVRAVTPPAAPPKPAARPAAPRPTLEDYLSGRKGGSQP
jgi:hypothetical protein